MVEVVKRERKGPVLTPSSIPCLRSLPTINITQGCALGCIYCYIKSYREYPGPNRVVLFTNTAELVANELKRKRKRPDRVYFSPSSDAFQYLPDVLDVTFDTMQVLLESGVEVAFLTKGFVSPKFIALFQKHAGLVHAQIGIVTLNQTIWKKLEPRTAPPLRRLRTMQQLNAISCRVTARLDPLIPDLTDISPQIDILLEKISGAGIRFAAASYMFLRPAFKRAAISAMTSLGMEQRLESWDFQVFADGCSSGKSISENDRRVRFARLREIGQRYGVTVSPCRCKNPGLADESCHIAGSLGSSGGSVARQLGLPFPAEHCRKQTTLLNDSNDAVK